MEVVGAMAQASRYREEVSLSVKLEIYSVIDFDSALVLPEHQVSGAIKIGDGVVCEAVSARFEGARTSESDRRLHTVQQGDRQVIQTGPGFLGAHLSGKPPEGYDWSTLNPISVEVVARPAGHSETFRVEVSIPRNPAARLTQGSAQIDLAKWRMTTVI
jgi:hypothetical protein